jgi:hypothetical protein
MSKPHISYVYDDVLGLVVGGGYRRADPVPLQTGLSVGIGWGLEVDGERRVRGQTPRRSSDEAWQTIEEHGEDRLVGGARRQMDLELGFQFDERRRPCLAPVTDRAETA